MLRGWLADYLQDLEQRAPKPPPDPRRESAEAEWDQPIPQYVLSLPRGDPVREVAEHLLACRKLDPGASGRLVSAVTGASLRTWKRGVVAAWCLGRITLSEEDTIAASNSLTKVLASRPPFESPPFDYAGAAMDRVLKASLITVAFILVMALVLAVPTLPGVLTTPHILLAALMLTFFAALFLFFVLSVFVFAPLIAPVSVAIDKSRIQRLRGQVAETLGQIGDWRCVGALIETSLEAAPRVRKPAYASLLGFLPQLSAEHREHLDPRLSSGLGRLLERAEPGEAHILLKALEKVGDGRAAEPVRLTVSRWRESPLRNEGERVLEILLERKRREDESAVLLRAAEDGSAQTLVRPAQYSESADSEALLRPTESAGL